MIVIGEKINASRKSVRTAIAAKDREAIVRQIEDQDKAGADYIDLNAGNPYGNITKEAEDMTWLIDIALDVTQKPLVLDSASGEVMSTAAEHLAGRRSWILNSVKNENSILEELIPIAVRTDASVVALAMDGETIPETTDLRMENCRAIRQKAGELGLKEENIFFDPLVMPISSNYKAGKVVLDTLRAIKTEFPNTKTTLGLSNVSYGLPHRQRINSALLISAIANGLDAAFCDPTRVGIRQAILLGGLVCGQDRYCRKFSRASRKGLFEN